MVPIPATDEVAAPAAVGEPEPEAATPPTRQCGRCRVTFPGDPTLAPGTLAGWWLCAPCRTALLGGPRNGR